MPRFVYFFVGRTKRGPEERTNRPHGVFVAAWTGCSPRAHRRRKTIQFDGRRAAPRTDRTIRENESNRNLVETHSRGSFGPSVGPAYAGPPVELRAVRLCGSVTLC